MGRWSTSIFIDSCTYEGRPDEHRQQGCQRGVPLRVIAANGTSAAATRAAMDPSGPTMSWREEPSRVQATVGSSSAYSPATGEGPASSA
jgi:hypothetical protein